MIINKEQIQAFDAQNREVRNLYISYINKNGEVSFLTYQIPFEQMFEWEYTNKAHADQEFIVTDAMGNAVIDQASGMPKKARWKSYDDKFIKRVPTKRDLSEGRLNEIINSWGKSVDGLFDATAPITWYCDIETDVNAEIGFPDPEKAIAPVNTIAITKFPQTIVFGRKPLTEKEKTEIQRLIDTYDKLTNGYKFEYKEFYDERSMLEAFVDFINPIPCISGWNFLGYDWQYIFNRCKNLGINLQRICPTNRFTRFKLNRKNVIDVKVPMHKIIADYMLIYRQWDRSIEVKESDKLDWVSEKALGIKKVNHPWGFEEFYRDHYMEYVFYNAVDTILVEKIDEKMKTASVWYMLASELRIDLNSAFSTILPAETVMTNFVYPNYKVVPKKVQKDEESGDYEGAFVWPTQPGIYKYIGGLDFASLYPSIIRQFLISPETFMFKDPTYQPKSDEIKTSSGAVYKINKDAVIPAILTHYFGLRKQAKKDRKSVDTDYEYLLKIYEKRKANGE